MADIKAVLGNLGDLRNSNDVLKFIGVDDVMTTLNNTGNEFEATIKLLDFQYVAGNFQGVVSFGDITSGVSNGFWLTVHNSVQRFEFWTYNGGVAERLFNVGSGFVDGDLEVSFGVDALGVKSLTVNGNTIQSAPTTVDVSVLKDLYIMSRGDGFHTAGIVSEFTLSGFDSVEWIMDNQFGNATVLDSSGSGNDGIRAGTQWWKTLNGKPVDISVPDDDALLALMPLTPVDVYTVIDIQTGAHPDTDIYWGNYANSAFLSVTIQYNFILWFISQEEERMTIDKTKRGSDLTGDDIQLLENRDYKVWATTQLTIQVRLSKDGYFVPMVIPAATPPLLLGEVHSINIATSTGDLDDLYLGYKE